MKTTLDLPDELVARARVQAAQEGVTLDALIERGLRLLLTADRPAPSPPPRSRLVSHPD